METDVLVVGAGAAGLTLAIELARRGARFLVIDKAESAFRGSRGKGIQPRSQEIFEDLGILDRVAASGGLYPPQREYRDDGSFTDNEIMEASEPTPAEPYRMPLMVPQFLTEAAMRERLAELGSVVEYGFALTGFVQHADCVVARMGERTVRARYLIGCDGGRSFVRQALEIGFPGKTLGVRALVADVALRGLGRDAWHRFGEGDMERQISYCPLMGTAMFQIQAPVPMEGEVDLSAQGLTAMTAERTGRRDIVVDEVFWASAFHMNARLADRYRAGRVFIAGDAAHVHPPTGGQGLNTSLQDAYNLGWKLAAVLEGAPDALLDSYEEERRPIAAEMLGLSTKLLDAAKAGSMKRGREVHQLDLGYPWSSLASGDGSGERAPDAPLKGAGGQTVRLFHLFQGSHWTLLGYETEARLAPRKGVRVHVIGSELRDAGGHFRDAYGVAPGTWVLVRPDGYIGAIAPAVETLERYLAQVTGRG
ncbi:MAG TPA: FAD-dependent oxidoreductase [Rhizomicrobium sp.]|nr:FAD-dependent oxidoreductase [Rhizomicrobium sp.]